VSVLTIAHRAGNDLGRLAGALEGGVDAVEADVRWCPHPSGGRLEVRHTKTMGPLPWLWDRWYLEPAAAPRLLLPDLLDALPEGLGVMLDLKGTNAVGPAVAELLDRRPPSRPVLVCTRHWPGLDPFFDTPRARPLLSAKGRAELARLRRRLRRGPVPYGVSLHQSLLTPSVVRELRDQVELVLAWPVPDQARADRVLAAGANGIVSTSPAVLARVRAAARE
jgi:hypothetical protein